MTVVKVSNPAQYVMREDELKVKFGSRLLIPSESCSRMSSRNVFLRASVQYLRRSPMMWSSTAPKVSITTGVNSLSTERQRAEYLATFFAARLLAAAPALVEDEGEPLMLDLAQGSAIAPSKKWWLPGAMALGMTASADFRDSGGKYPLELWQ